MRKIGFGFFILFLFMLNGCQSANQLKEGIQLGYQAINPASIIAVPIFVLPNPSQESAWIDSSLLETEKIIPKLETAIVQTNFTNQPNVNGYSFSAVKKAVSLSSAPGQTVLDSMKDNLKSVAQRFSSRNTKTRLLISPSCMERKNFLEFYVYCLANEKNWLADLNRLSAEVLNSDTALLTVVTNLQDKMDEGVYEIHGGLSVLLVDTNNGKLIWGNEKDVVLINPPEKKSFPNWTQLFQNIFLGDFWQGFPGRIAKETTPVAMNHKG